MEHSFAQISLLDGGAAHARLLGTGRLLGDSVSGARPRPCRPPQGLSPLARRTAGGQRALSVGRSARGGAAARAPVPPARRLCWGFDDRSAAALPGEAGTHRARGVPNDPPRGQRWAGAGAAWGAHPCPGRRQTPAPAPPCTQAVPWLLLGLPVPGPFRASCPGIFAGHRRGAVAGGPLSRSCRPQALHAAQGLGTPVASLRAATPVGPESPERPPKLKRGSWRSLPTGGRRPREATWPRKPLVSPAG